MCQRSSRAALRLRRLLITDGFASCRPQFCAVTPQNLNQIALRLDDRALFNDEHGHESVGDHEQYREQREKTPPLFGNRDRHHCCGTERNRQVAPQPA